MAIEVLDDAEVERNIVLAREPPLKALPARIDEQDVQEVIKALENPVTLQKELAAKLKIIIDERIQREMKEDNALSKGTKEWVDSYNNMLNNIQSNMYGTKNLNLNLTGKVSHSQIGAMIRKYESAVVKSGDDKQTVDSIPTTNE